MSWFTELGGASGSSSSTTGTPEPESLLVVQYPGLMEPVAGFSPAETINPDKWLPSLPDFARRLPDTYLIPFEAFAPPRASLASWRLFRAAA